MKNIIKSGFGIALAMMMLLVACDPNEFDKSDLQSNSAPTAEEMDFIISPGEDAFHFTLENLTTLSGINTVKWDLGNGSTDEGNSVVAYYPLSGTYEITLTITATDGSTGVKTSTIEQTETDYSIFTDPKYLFLSGGSEDLDGKTWVLDSLEAGHIGLGSLDGDGLDYWSVEPMEKASVGVFYDDKITFNINGFSAVYENHGQSYVRTFRATDPHYSNGYEDGGDYVVDYTPEPGTWSISEKDGVAYLYLKGETPLFPIFDVGAFDNEYRILSIEENKMELVAKNEEDFAWHIQLIPEGYVKPVVTFDLLVADNAEVNTYDFSLANVVIPTGESIGDITWNLGEGDEYISSDYNEVVSHTYMRKGPYTVSVSVETSAGTFTANQTITVTDHHPDYEEFLLDEMVVYSDFSEVELAPVLGEDCSVSIVDNPDVIYPNKSSKVAYYSKDQQAWANANMTLPAGYRFDLRLQSTFKLKVYGEAGDVVLLKLENTDNGGNAWQTGAELRYTIQSDNTWEVVEYNFEGVGTADLSWDPGLVPLMASDITTDDRYSHDFYNILRIMLNPDIENDQAHSFYFDDLAGPHVEGIKSAQQN